MCAYVCLCNKGRFIKTAEPPAHTTPKSMPHLMKNMNLIRCEKQPLQISVFHHSYMRDQITFSWPFLPWCLLYINTQIIGNIFLWKDTAAPHSERVNWPCVHKLRKVFIILHVISVQKSCQGHYFKSLNLSRTRNWIWYSHIKCEIMDELFNYLQYVYTSLT